MSEYSEMNAMLESGKGGAGNMANQSTDQANAGIGTSTGQSLNGSVLNGMVGIPSQSGPKQGPDNT